MLKAVQKINGPAFSAYAAADTTITTNTFTKVNIDTEDFDSDGVFDTATNRFTPNVAGYYQVSAAVNFSASATPTRCIGLVYKNGSEFKRIGDSVSSGNQVCGSCLVYLNGSTDYIELYTRISAATAAYAGGAGSTYFQAALVRSA
jgi:hypothetical protein